MPTDGVFNPKLDEYSSARVRGEGAEHVRRGTAFGDGGLNLGTPGKKRGKRGSTFTMESLFGRARARSQRRAPLPQVSRRKRAFSAN